MPDRQLTTLGRTGLTCSVVGLGCGGVSRLGLRKGGTMNEAADLVRYALDLGITFIDTAKTYGTEPAVGMALKGRRQGVVVSTKVWPVTPDDRVDATFISSQIDDSLAVLGLDTIDIVHLHCVKPQDYARVIGECLPPMERARKEGKIRHIGLSEFWSQDPRHETLQRALRDDYFDVILAGCNMLNSSARRLVFPKAQENGVATLLMFAAREIAADDIDLKDRLGFLIDPDGAATLTEAAYRYCRHLPGVNVVLTGTGDRAHLRENIAAIEAPPLTESQLRRIDALFGEVDSVTGAS